MTLETILGSLLSASVALNIGLLVRAKIIADVKSELTHDVAEWREESTGKFSEIAEALAEIRTALGETERDGLRGRMKEVGDRAHRAEAAGNTAMTKVEELNNRVREIAMRKGLKP